VTDERGLFEGTTLEAFQSGPVVADDPAQAERVAGRFCFEWVAVISRHSERQADLPRRCRL
jgi:hypothetical protein